MTKKFNLKQATFGGIAGLVAPYLLIIFITGLIMWDWNQVNIILKELFLIRLSTILCITGFLIGGFLKNDN